MKRGSANQSTDYSRMNIYGQRNMSQKLNSMSSRQQVLFLLQQTMNEADWNMNNNKEEESKESKNIVIVNKNEVFEAMRKKQFHDDLEQHPERFRQLADSLNQFIPIRRNKIVDMDSPYVDTSIKDRRKELVDRKRNMMSERDNYV